MTQSNPDNIVLDMEFYCEVHEGDPKAPGHGVKLGEFTVEAAQIEIQAGDPRTDPGWYSFLRLYGRMPDGKLQRVFLTIGTRNSNEDSVVIVPTNAPQDILTTAPAQDVMALLESLPVVNYRQNNPRFLITGDMKERALRQEAWPAIAILEFTDRKRQVASAGTPALD